MNNVVLEYSYIKIPQEDKREKIIIFLEKFFLQCWYKVHLIEIK